MTIYDLHPTPGIIRDGWSVPENGKLKLQRCPSLFKYFIKGCGFDRECELVINGKVVYTIPKDEYFCILVSDAVKCGENSIEFCGKGKLIIEPVPSEYIQNAHFENDENTSYICGEAIGMGTLSILPIGREAIKKELDNEQFKIALPNECKNYIVEFNDDRLVCSIV